MTCMTLCSLNKEFWKAIKPIFSQSKTKLDNIPLQEGDRMVTECKEVCQIFNKFFSEIGTKQNTQQRRIGTDI